LEQWYNQQKSTKKYEKTVVLFADTYINYHEPHVGKAAIGLLNDCGYEVVLASVGCCQRPKISNGFLKEAKKEGSVLAEKLKPYFEKGWTVVVCEPSCTSALTDDLPDLIEDDNCRKNAKKHQSHRRFYR
jgi:Fe-S oxidoreductase